MDFALHGINPLRGLDHVGLLGILEQGEYGAWAMPQWLFRAVEKHCPAGRAVKRRLLAAVGSLQWSIRVANTGDDPARAALATAQADTLKAAYSRIENLYDALEHLVLAELRGFSHLEKIYDRTGPDRWAVKELRPVDQWFLCRHGHYGEWEYNPEAKPGVRKGIPLNMRDWIVREVDDPADEIIAICHLKQCISDADWDAFLEDYGVPPMFIVMPPGISPDQEKEYQRAAERAVSAARGALPHGSTIVTPRALDSGGVSVFRDRLQWLNKEIVIAGTSGQLTILAESGTGTLAGGAQKDAFDDLALSIARRVSEAMQAQFDKPELERTWPGEPVLAYFEFHAKPPKKGHGVIDNAAKLMKAGYRLELKQLSELTGWTLKERQS